MIVRSETSSTRAASSLLITPLKMSFIALFSPLLDLPSSSPASSIQFRPLFYTTGGTIETWKKGTSLTWDHIPILQKKGCSPSMQEAALGHEPSCCSNRQNAHKSSGVRPPFSLIPPKVEVLSRFRILNRVSGAVGDDEPRCLAFCSLFIS